MSTEQKMDKYIEYKIDRLIAMIQQLPSDRTINVPVEFLEFIEETVEYEKKWNPDGIKIKNDEMGFCTVCNCWEPICKFLEGDKIVQPCKSCYTYDDGMEYEGAIEGCQDEFAHCYGCGGITDVNNQQFIEYDFGGGFYRYYCEWCEVVDNDVDEEGIYTGVYPKPK